MLQAMAIMPSCCSFAAAPRFFPNDRTCRLSSFLRARRLLHLSSLQSSFHAILVSAQRTSPLKSPTSTSIDGLRSRTRTTAAAAAAAPAVSIQNLVPPSVLERAPTLLGAMVPVVFAVYLSKKLNLGLDKEIYVAIFRASAQLTLLGLGFKVVFEGQNVALSIIAMMIMVVVAGQTSGERTKLLPRSKLVCTAALVGGSFGTIWLMVLLRVYPMEPKVLIPATGYFVGSSMTVVSNTLNFIQNEIHLHEQEIEAALALGATPHQAVREHLRISLIRALGPTFDYMKVSGLVTLPGAMTGMLMSGSHPLEAVRSSLVLLYMLVGASTVTSIIGAQLGWRSLFSSSFQLVKP